MINSLFNGQFLPSTVMTISDGGLGGAKRSRYKQIIKILLTN